MEPKIIKMPIPAVERTKARANLTEFWCSSAVSHTRCVLGISEMSGISESQLQDTKGNRSLDLDVYIQSTGHCPEAVRVFEAPVPDLARVRKPPKTAPAEDVRIQLSPKHDESILTR